LGKLRGEIDLLDKRRLRLLRKRPSIVERVLHRSGTKLEESTSALQSKRTDFDDKGTLFQHELDELRANYEAKRGHLRERQQSLKAKLAEFNRNTSNDALEVRNAACQELCRAVAQAVDRSSKAQIAADAENTQ
jgi:molecular chaperone GrpE (heat shock protein)